MKFSEKIPEIDTIIESLRNYFDKDRIEKEAKETKFIQKPKQLTGMAFFSICLMQGVGYSLSTMCGALSWGFSIKMCEQSLNERFTDNAVAFMKLVFEQMLQMELAKVVPMDFLSKFKGVFIQDATNIKLPDGLSKLYKGSGGSAGKSSAKVDFTMDVQGTACQMDIRSAAGSDNTCEVKNPKKGALYIRDLGYFNITFFYLIMEAGAYFLSRLKSKTSVYGDIFGKTRLDICEMAQKMKTNEVLHSPVFIGGHKLLPVFLILQKLPPEVVALKIKRAQKDHRKRMTKMSKDQLEWCQFNSYVTNIPLGWFPALTLIQIYGIRWQIEIMFKVWKSVFKIDTLGKIMPNRAMCILYGRLIWITLQMKIFRVYKVNIYGISQKEASELSAFKQMDEYKKEFGDAVKSGMGEVWRTLIYSLYEVIQRFTIKKPRKNKVPPLYNPNFK